MKKLSSSRFKDIDFIENQKLIKITWKSATKDMTNDLFKLEMAEFPSFFNLGIKYILHNMENMQYTVVPEIQSWIDNNINKKAVDSGVQRLAFVLGADIFSSISVQQANEAKNIQPIDIKYFKNEISAMEWITS